MEKPVRKAEFREAGEGNGSIQSVVGGVTVGDEGVQLSRKIPRFLVRKTGRAERR